MITITGGFCLVTFINVTFQMLSHLAAEKIVPLRNTVKGRYDVAKLLPEKGHFIRQ